MRLYGYDCQRSRATLLVPGILVENLFRFGMRSDDNFIRSHTPEVQWVTGSSVVGPYILLTFPSFRNKKEVERKRANIDVSYRPHGNQILMRDDLFPEEERCSPEAQRRCEALRNKGFAVVQSDLSIRVGRKPNANWYEYDAPEVSKLLDDCSVAPVPK